MNSRLLLVSVGLHGALIVGVGAMWSLGGARPDTPARLSLAPSRPAVSLPPSPRAPEEAVVEEPPQVVEPTMTDIEELDVDFAAFEPSRPVPEPLREPGALAAVALAPIAQPEPPEPESRPESVPVVIRARLLDGRNAAPDYPALARRLGLEGSVVLRLRVDATGAVTSVEVRTSSGHDCLDRAAVKAATGWHFAPARRDDQRIADVVEQTIRFVLPRP